MRIEAGGLTKRYSGIPALNGVSLDLPAGQIAAVIGVNGAGKSTLLYCLAGLMGWDDGDIMLDGQRLRRDNLELRRRFSFIPDVPLMLSASSVARNLALAISAWEADRPGIEDEMAAVLEELGILNEIHAPVESLSRGELAKAALAVMLVIRPALWMLDEPFASGMDLRGIETFRRHARAHAAAGGTVLFSTQIPEVVTGFANTVVVLSKGRVIDCCPPEEIAARPGGWAALAGG